MGKCSCRQPETVCIPLSELLLHELQAAKASRSGESEYVWPEQAEMQLKNQQGVSWRIGQVFKAAGFSNEERHATRATGGRKASVKDFHSLRTTWITEALTNGVPIAMVKLISGHRTTEVVLEFYHHPDQKQVRDTLQAAMPTIFPMKKSIIEPSKASPHDEMRNIIDKMTVKTLKRDKLRLLELLEGV